MTITEVAPESLYCLPPIRTARLALRPLRPLDIAAIYQYARDPEVTRDLIWESHRSPEDTERFVRSVFANYEDPGARDWTWGITRPGEDRVLGCFGFHEFHRTHRRVSAGYVLAREEWGREYMTEVLRAAIDFGFRRLALHRIEASVFTGNGASARVMEKAGMSYEGTAREAMFVKERWRDVRRFAILRGEWECPENGYSTQPE